MEIDLRVIDLAPARTARVLGLFAELPAGRAFTFVSTRSEPEALARLQAEHPGEFEWYPIEEGPVHRVVVARRPANAPRRRQVLEFMEADHRRIHALLDTLSEAVVAGSLEGVRQTVLELRTSLGRHFRMEEERLLPVVAERFATPRGPAVVLREEHIEIAALVDRLEATTVEGDTDAVGELAIALDKLLVHHAGIEERILYALTDLLLDDQERDELVRRCQLL
jgi:uncharacterized protein (DUF2249 family)